jgi:hypothetical protein
MTPLLMTIGLPTVTLFIGEVCLWRMFRRRIDPMIFPVEHDVSQLGLFRPNRMRAFAIVHTIILSTWIVCSVLFLW